MDDGNLYICTLSKSIIKYSLSERIEIKKKGDFTYREDAERIILSFVNVQPQSTAAITRRVKKAGISKIHFYTVRRILEKLNNEGKIKTFKVGRCQLWSK